MKKFIFVLFLVGCASKQHIDDSLPISAIPQGCAPYEVAGRSMDGFHQFGNSDSDVLWATANDCGIREGKRCFYFVHNPDAFGPNFVTDINCEVQ